MGERGSMEPVIILLCVNTISFLTSLLPKRFGLYAFTIASIDLHLSFLTRDRHNPGYFCSSFGKRGEGRLQQGSRIHLTAVGCDYFIPASRRLHFL